MTQPSPQRIAELWLKLADIALAKLDRDGGSIWGQFPADLAWLLDHYALVAPRTAARLPRVRAALAPEVLQAVKQQASATPGSRTLLSARDAASVLGITDRAVRMAAAAGKLTATRHPVTGEWRIDRASVESYRRRRAA